MTRSEVRSKLFTSFVKSTFNARVLIAFLLCVTLVISAFMVVIVKYHYKMALDKEQKLLYQQEDLRDQWTQILIEHSTLASPSHVEEVAKKNDMRLPSVKETKVIQSNA
ncbi:cell division protein FtsL [Cysteiniphilum litorale]|uniref:cell division protein FtsL n=1 Tax=Cysteiniphilum litorale TaxID=2056700 RepID=UPI003F883CD9